MFHNKLIIDKIIIKRTYVKKSQYTYDLFVAGNVKKIEWPNIKKRGNAIVLNLKLQYILFFFIQI